MSAPKKKKPRPRKSKAAKKKHQQWLMLVWGVIGVLLLLIGALAWQIWQSKTQPLPAEVRDEPVVPVVHPAKPKSPKVKLEPKPALPVLDEAVEEEHLPPTLFVPDEPPAIERVSSGLALIIDDMGYDTGAMRRLMALSIPLTVSILPNAPKAKAVATMAHDAGYMVMLHLPMEPEGERYRKRMDVSFLKQGMDEAMIRQVMLKDLARVPFAAGVNNHMGSRLTSLREPMNWVMQVCREQGLFFVDSLTSSRSVAASVAKQYGLPWAKRVVFLDDSLEPEAMRKSWQKIQRCMHQKRRCVMIAHPHAITLDFLHRKQSELQAWPVYPVSRLLQ